MCLRAIGEFFRPLLNRLGLLVVSFLSLPSLEPHELSTMLPKLAALPALPELAVLELAMMMAIETVPVSVSVPVRKVVRAVSDRSSSETPG